MFPLVDLFLQATRRIHGQPSPTLSSSSRLIRNVMKSVVGRTWGKTWDRSPQWIFYEIYSWRGFKKVALNFGQGTRSSVTFDQFLNFKWRIQTLCRLESYRIGNTPFIIHYSFLSNIGGECFQGCTRCNKRKVLNPISNYYCSQNNLIIDESLSSTGSVSTGGKYVESI